MESNLAYQEDWREELIGGKLVAMGTPSTNHGAVVLNLSRIFGNYLHGKPCTPFGDNTKVFLTEENRFIPDAMIVCDSDAIQLDGVHGAPDLVVEVLSPSTADYDKRHKKDAYEKSGVKEYWIISPEAKTVEQYILRDGRFSLDGVFAVYPDWMLKNMKPEERAAVAAEFKCSLYDDFVIRLDDIFARVK